MRCRTCGTLGVEIEDVGPNAGGCSSAVTVLLLVAAD
eukprot:COSAG05_NODE_20342_length_280_cov_0.751381_1_plen_36_part_10